MEMRLYQTRDNENVINKVKALMHTINIKLKNSVDIVTPTIILQDDGSLDLMTCNYVWLSEFNRYYFVRGIENRNENTWAMQLECDVLESFKDDFMNNHVRISRTLQDGDYYNVAMETETKREIDIYRSEVTLSNEKTIILSTIGVG